MTARDDREREKSIRETIGKFFLIWQKLLSPQW